MAMHMEICHSGIQSGKISLLRYSVTPSLTSVQRKWPKRGFEAIMEGVNAESDVALLSLVSRYDAAKGAGIHNCCCMECHI